MVCFPIAIHRNGDTFSHIGIFPAELRVSFSSALLWLDSRLGKKKVGPVIKCVRVCCALSVHCLSYIEIFRWSHKGALRRRARVGESRALYIALPAFRMHVHQAHSREICGRRVEYVPGYTSLGIPSAVFLRSAATSLGTGITSSLPFLPPSYLSFSVSFSIIAAILYLVLAIAFPALNV